MSSQDAGQSAKDHLTVLTQIDQLLGSVLCILLYQLSQPLPSEWGYTSLRRKLNEIMPRIRIAGIAGIAHLNPSSPVIWVVGTSTSNCGGRAGRGARGARARGQGAEHAGRGRAASSARGSQAVRFEQSQPHFADRR